MANELNKFDKGDKVRFFNPETDGMDPVTFEVMGTHEGKAEWFYYISGFDPEIKDTIDLKHVNEKHLMDPEDILRFATVWLDCNVSEVEDFEIEDLMEAEKMGHRMVLMDATLSGLASYFGDAGSTIDELEVFLNERNYVYNGVVYLCDGMYYYSHAI